MADLLQLLHAHDPSLTRGIRFGSADADFVSYSELWQGARQRAVELSRGLQRGARVLLVGDNSQPQVESLLGCWWAGLVPICVTPPARLSPGQNYLENLHSWIEASEAQAGFCEEELLARCSPAHLPRGWRAWPSGQESCAGLPRSETDLAYVQFSSGTTRRSKAVALCDRSLCHNIQAILGIHPPPLSQHSCVSWLPLYHDMGLVGSLLSALAAPGNLVLMRPYQFAARPISWLQALTSSRATVSPAPNFALRQCLERVRDEQLGELDLSCWQLALIGSETIHPQTLRQFHQRFAPCGLRWESLTPVYGLAEATLAVTFSPPGRGPTIFTGEHGRELVSLGPALPGIEVRIADEQGLALPPGVQGRVLTRSPSVMWGYLNQAPHAVEDWLDTGDLGTLQDGELYLTGRSKDTLIVRGRNYDPEAVEQALEEVEGLDPGRAAAVPTQDDSSVFILAERRRKETLPEDGQRAQARAAVARRTGLIVEVVLVDAGWLPRTTSGKVRRSAARERYLESLQARA